MHFAPWCAILEIVLHFKVNIILFLCHIFLSVWQIWHNQRKSQYYFFQWLMIFLQAKWHYLVKFKALNLRLREIFSICWLPIHLQLYSDLTCQGRNIKIDKIHWRKFSICWKQLGEEYWDTTHNFLHEGVNTIYFNMQMNNERLKRGCWLQKTQRLGALYTLWMKFWLLSFLWHKNENKGQ